MYLYGANIISVNIVDILSSLIILIYAYTIIGFIHGDLHLGNLILQKTKRKNINYEEFGNIEIILI